MDRISISKFVNEYLSLDPPDRKSYLDSIMTKKYVPCLDKNTIISAMLEGAIDTQYDIPRINYFAVHIDFNMALLIMYTKLSIDKNGEDDKEAIFRAYDLLKENELFWEIYERIGEDEYNECYMIKDMILSKYKDDASTGAQLSKFVVRAGAVIDSGMKVFNDQISELAKNNPDSIVQLSERIAKLHPTK